MNKIIRLIPIYFIVGCFYVCSNIALAYGDTYVSGNITTDTIWTKANSPYIVTGTVQVLEGATLTIEPGVVIRFILSSNHEPLPLRIGGQLVAIGTEQERINFIYAEETYNQCGDCPMIEFTEGSVDAVFDENGNYLNGSIIGYSNIDGLSKVKIDSSSPYIVLNFMKNTPLHLHDSHSIILSNVIDIDNNNSSALRSFGIFCAGPFLEKSCQIYNNKINITIDNLREVPGAAIILSWLGGSLIQNNEIEIFSSVTDPSMGSASMDGIYLDEALAEIRDNVIKTNYNGRPLNINDSKVSIIHNDLSSNNSYRCSITVSGFLKSSVETTLHYNNLERLDNWHSNSIDATENYWGTTYPIIIDMNIFDYYDDITLGKVNYKPIRNEPFKITAYNSFSDVPSDYWAYDYILAIYNAEITTGCAQDDLYTLENERRYCPEDNVTRGQMAAFIIRALYGESFAYTQTPYFTDVPSTHGFFKYIQKMKDDGITAVTGTYDVDGTVARAQMAAFLSRAFLGME